MTCKGWSSVRRICFNGQGAKVFDVDQASCLHESYPKFITCLNIMTAVRNNAIATLANRRTRADNNGSNSGQETDQTVTGTSSEDELTGGLGDDIVVGGTSDDVLVGDGPIAGAWHYETFSYNFSSAAGQAFDFGSDPAERTGSGYVTDFNESNLTNTVNGTTGNPSDFGVIYTSTLNVTAGGTYTFATQSDDGSTIQIFDSDGNAVNFLNQDGSTADFMNNDFHQGPTTRTGEATLDAGETYTVQIRYWENAGGDVLSATVEGPDTGGVTDDLLTTDMLGLPPGPDFSTTGVPAGVEGDDTIYGGGGDDTISGNGGDDVLFGDADGPGGTSDGLFDVEYYELGGAPGNLAAAGFDAVGTNSNTPTASFLDNDLDVGGISLDNGGDRQTYAVRFETTLTVTDGGTYTFTTTSDDGSKLLINGVEIVDNDGLHGAVTENGSTFLAPGDYNVVIIFFENSGGDSLSATISGDDTGNVPINIIDADIVAPSTGAIANLPGNDVIDAGASDDAKLGGDGNDTFIEVAGDGGGTMFKTDIGSIPVEAIKLIEIEDIEIANDIETVSYFHVLFDNHQVVLAEDAPTEGFYAGDQALRSIPVAALKELFALFPALACPDDRQLPAMTLPSGCD